jgi:hypothetical protein
LNVLAAIQEEMPRFIVTLDAALSPEASLVRVPLAITGKWARGASQFAITRQDLADIVGNFGERLNGEINVDYDHASEMPEVAAGGPIPSAGRIVKLDRPEPVGPGLAPARPTQGSALQDGRFILYGWFEPTPRARQLIQNREYRFISPAIEWGARSKRTGKPQGTTLTSVALTNRPFLEEMPQIRLSDPAFQLVGEPAGLPREGRALPCATNENRNSKIENRNSKLETGNLKLEARNSKIENRPASLDFPISRFDFPLSNTGGSMKHVTLSRREGKIHIAHDELPDEFYFDADDLASVGAPTDRGEAPPRGSTAALSESAVINYAQARALLSEAEAQGKFLPAAEVFHAQAERELEEAARAGKILPRQRDDWRKIALSDLPTFRKLMSAQKPVVPLAPVGFAGTPPADVQVQVKFLAEQRMREKQISFGQALSDIGREQPDLVQQYRKAVSGNE